MRNAILFTAALTVLGLSAGERPDPRTRTLVDPVRVWGSVAAEKLTSPKFGQVAEGEFLVGSGPVLKRGDWVMLDFGRELHGAVQIGSGAKSGNRSVAHVRFGESVSEAMSELGERGACNDHAIRDEVVRLPWYGRREIGETGFRFVRIDNAGDDPVQLDYVRAVSVMRPMKRLGAFASSDPRLDRVFETAVRTVHLCCQDYLWDGVKRDRLVWMGDTHPETMAVLNVFGAAEVLPESLDYMAATTAPDQWMNTMPTYTLWWIRNLAEWYRYTGDIAYLEKHADYLERTFEHVLKGMDGNGMWVSGNFLDWPTKHNDRAATAGTQGLALITARETAFLAGALGRSALQRKAEEMARTLSVLKPDPHGAKSSAALLALSGLRSPREMYDGVLGRNGHADVSTFYGYYMLEAMSAAGEDGRALETVRDYWGGMLDMGATSFWEDFDLSWTNGAFRIDEPRVAGVKDVHGDYGDFCYQGFRHSLCHGWSAGPAAWCINHVLGIRPLDVGCKTVEVRPFLGDLEWAEGAMALPDGGCVKVRAERRADGGIEVSVSAPPGVKIVRAEEAPSDDAAKHGSTAMNSGAYAAKGGTDEGLRVLFLGNSIALHGPDPAIGWTNDWGMAASSAEKDFVHIVTRGVEEHFGRQTSVMVRNLADFERNFRTWSMTNLAEAVAFDPQVLVIALGENVPDLKTDADREDFRQAFRRLFGVFLDGRRTKPIAAVRGVFWPNAAKDAEMASAAGDYALPFVKADVFSEPGMNAKDAGWSHAGVAAHPGDKGMAEIARRILETLFPTDSGFAATVNGEPVKVRPIRVSAMEFNRWPVERWQRPADQTEVAGMVTVEADGATEWTVRPSRAFTNAVVRPLSARVKCVAESGEVRFTLPRTGYYTLELDGFHRPLQMFVEPKRDFAAEKKSATMYFGPGNHYAGEIRLKSRDRVYIDRDAYVYGMFGIEDAEDVMISGYGVICGSVGRRCDLECYGGVNATPIWAVRSKGVKVCGPTVIDSACWCVATFGCRDVELSHLKVTGAWRYNTDGVDICNSEDVRLHDSFIHSFDDTVVIKGMPLYRGFPVGNIRVERCVCWCGWGGTLETGLETWAGSWRNVTFEDCDLIHNSMAALRLHLGGPCKVEDTAYRNIRIEYDASEREPEIHRNHDDKYTKRGGGPWVGSWLSIQNYKMYSPNGLYKNPNVSPDEPHGSFGKAVFEDIDITVESGVPLPGQAVRFVDGTSLGEIGWRNVRLNGKPIAKGF